MEHQEEEGPLFSEDRLGWQFNRCVNDGVLKMAAGGAIGVAAKRLIVRKNWPIYVAVGVAFGLAWQNCERELRYTLTTCRNPPPLKENLIPADIDLPPLNFDDDGGISCLIEEIVEEVKTEQKKRRWFWH